MAKEADAPRSGITLKLPQWMKAKILIFAAQKAMQSMSYSQPPPYAMLFYWVIWFCPGFPS